MSFESSNFIVESFLWRVQISFGAKTKNFVICVVLRGKINVKGMNESGEEKSRSMFCKVCKAEMILKFT